MAVKAEPVSPRRGDDTGSQMREWLQSGVCPGVRTEEPANQAAARAAAGPKKFQEEPDGGVWFFLIDAFEDDRASPPRVYLFGKVKSSATGQFQTCCLVVECIERAVHLLLNVKDPDPDQPEAAAEVARSAEAEFFGLCREQCPGIKVLRSKLKWRNYAFEKPLPDGCDGCLPFLKVVCDPSGQMPPLGMSGQHFRYSFGVQTSLLERLLITRRIVGPSWLRLAPKMWKEDPARLSFCAVELRIRPESICAPKKTEDVLKLQEMGMPTSSPPIRLMSISMQTMQKSAQEPHEALVIACTMHPNVSPDASESEQELRSGISTWVAVRRIDSAPLPRGSDELLAKKQVAHFNNETVMLAALLNKIQEFDPDAIAGHNAYGFDLDVIGSRMHALKLGHWQRLGRLRRPGSRMPRMEGRQGAGFWVGANLTNGRLVCDLLVQAKDLLPKLGSYDLPMLARAQLGLAHLPVVEPEALLRHYDTAEALSQLAESTFHCALCVARLVHSLQLLPLSKQLTNLAGNLWNMSLQNKRAERNEMLLCHEFHKKKFVLPDKESLLTRKRRLQVEGGGAAGAGGMDEPDDQEQAAGGAAPRRGKAEYTGGLVLDPKVGLYDDFVMLLDFNSLYPSIIQEHNICFTTVERPNEMEVSRCQSEVELLGKTRAPDGTEEEGVLPKVLRTLVESRRTVKNAIRSERDSRRLQMLEIRQKALKLTANSMYGCLGFRHSRFYAKPLAALITSKGREALQTTIAVVQQELTLDVVYGDTDSVFVNTKTQDFDQAMQAAEQIKRSVNKKYKRLEIEIDGIFATVMLLKKKKYAAVKVVDWKKQVFETEVKGLDIVRRDWCRLAKEVGEKVLLKVLNREGKEEAVQWVHGYLTEQGQMMDEKQVPLEKYVITKGLTKDPRDYPDAKNQPHVQVALRLQARGRAIRPGQEVEYVVSEPSGPDGAKVSLAERARHPHEFTLDPSLRVDVDWYKKHQVHPLVSRLLEPVEGTDAARIAECLGLDGTRFARAAAARADAEGGSCEPDLSYVQAASADVNALFDRRTRWSEFSSGSLPDGRTMFPGVECVTCKTVTPWSKLLAPDEEAWGSNGVANLFRCATCKAEVNPVRARNLYTMQVRELLREHCKGWVRCAEDSCIEKTRRIGQGQNMVSERAVLRELEHMEYLCEAESRYPGQDERGSREAIAGMRQVSRWQLECSGYNWVDCGAIFAGIFNAPKA